MRFFNDNNDSLCVEWEQAFGHHNDCERCDTVGIVVLSPEGERLKGVSGLGVTLLSSIGLTMAKLRQADAHIQSITKFIGERIIELRAELHHELRASLDAGAAWKMAPVARFPDATKVSERRL